MASPPKTTETSQDQRRLYSGHVIYMFAFDLAYDMVQPRITELLGQPLREYTIGPSKRSPKQFFFYRPQRVVFPPEPMPVFDRSAEVVAGIKIFSIGAISIRISVPFQGESLESLVRYHGLQINQRARTLAGQVLEALRPYCIRPVSSPAESEEYTVFQIDPLPGSPRADWSAETWFTTNRPAIAGLLTEEQDPAHLSEQEITESTQAYLSYYTRDLLVVDWDAALVMAEPDTLEDVLHIMEVANVQLLELGVYDRMLDTAMDRVYRDLYRSRVSRSRKVHQTLREIRVDMARFSDELLNVTKFFGDWHLARLYQGLSGRFHLQDWYRTINEKLKVLADLYQLLQQDSVNFWMAVMEATIILLFIADLAFLFVDK